MDRQKDRHQYFRATTNPFSNKIKTSVKQNRLQRRELNWKVLNIPQSQVKIKQKNKSGCSIQKSTDPQ